MSARDYQSRLVNECREAIKRHRSCVLVMPTGSGKTVVASLISQLVVQRPGQQIMFVVHRRELVKQALDTFKLAVPGAVIGIEAAGWPSSPWAPVQIGMVQSMVRRDYIARMKPSLIFWDEAHHVRASTWEKVMDWWPDIPRIGLTATPERLDGKGLGQSFATMVQGPNIRELVADGYLAPCRTLTVPIDIDTSGIKTNRRGEYAEKDINSRITEQVVVDAADSYVRYARGRRAIFFGENRDHSRRVVGKLQEMGINAAHVDGEDHPARRDRIMQEFRDGALDVVGNCDLISEGFDAPSCEVVMLGKRTGSITRYLQQAGRAMRPGPGKEALILDLAGISHNLGLPDEPREWSLEDGELKQAKEKKAMPHECPQCHTMHYGGKCPHCAFQPPMAEVQESRVDLVEATGRPKTKGAKRRRQDLMRDIHMAKGSPDPRKALEDIAQRSGYKSGWVSHILRAWGYA